MRASGAGEESQGLGCMVFASQEGCLRVVSLRSLEQVMDSERESGGRETEKERERERDRERER